MSVVKLDSSGLETPMIKIGESQLTSSDEGKLIWNDEIIEKPDLSGYITDTELNSKNYLTSSALTDYAKKTDLNSYATTSSLSSYLKSSDVKAYVSTKWLSGTNWYKKYNDGWIEQGGISAAVSGAGQITVSLNTAFKNTNYTITIATDNTDPGADQGNEATAIKSKTTTSFNVYKWNMRKVSWYACGY